MDNSAFIELLRDAKVLSKHDLTSHYADMIFKEHATEKRINFGHFREEMVPVLAAKKKMSVDDLLARFCRVEDRQTVQARTEMEEVASVTKQVSVWLTWHSRLLSSPFIL